MTKFLGKGGGAEARRNVSCRSAGEKRRTRSLEVEELEEENYKWKIISGGSNIASSESRRVKRRILDKY